MGGDLERLPGGERVAKGLADLARGEQTCEALLVSIAAPLLRRLGFPIREVPDAEIALYELLQAEHGDAAHARYNALLRELVSFQRAARCAA